VGLVRRGEQDGTVGRDVLATLDTEVEPVPQDRTEGTRDAGLDVGDELVAATHWGRLSWTKPRTCAPPDDRRSAAMADLLSAGSMISLTLPTTPYV